MTKGTLGMGEASAVKVFGTELTQQVARELLEVLDQLGSDDMLMYASHYPRVHAADPEDILLRYISPNVATKVRAGNASALYGL